jgi:hypothetical protein
MAAVATKAGLLERLCVEVRVAIIGRLGSADVQFAQRDEEVG